MNNLFAILLIVAVVGAASLAPAPVYYVDVATGNDANSGLDSDVAWATIEKGMETVAAGDKVWVLAGTYTAEHGSTGAIGSLVTAGGSTTPIVFEGWNGVSTGTHTGDGTMGCVILDCGPNALVNGLILTGESYYVIKFFRVTGASGNGFSAATLTRSALYMCKANNNGGIGLTYGANTAAVGCLAENNTGHGIYALEAINCISRTNTQWGIVGGTDSHFIGCSVTNNGNTQMLSGFRSTVYACTIDGGNTDKGIDEARSYSHILNTIIFDCTNGITGTAGSEELAISLYNIYYSNTNNVVNWPTDPSDVFGDPLFVDAANNDYRLGTGSPALAAGLDVGVIDGITSTSYIDIGALQAQPTGGTTVIVIDD